LPKILIVEDDLPMTRLLQTLLSLEGFETVSTPRADAVVKMTHEERPSLLVMDLHLGQDNTLDILKELKRDPATQHVPIIIVSGLEAEDACTKAVADAFILKPYSPNKLIEAMRTLVR
jgi:DNA-binding response OmpR family regulator